HASRTPDLARAPDRAVGLGRDAPPPPARENSARSRRAGRALLEPDRPSARCTPLTSPIRRPRGSGRLGRATGTPAIRQLAFRALRRSRGGDSVARGSGAVRRLPDGPARGGTQIARLIPRR